MRTQERLANCLAKFVQESVRPATGNFKKKLACQRITIGVQTNRRQSEHDIAWRDRATVDDLFPIHHADNEAGDVVFTISVETGHLGRLAPEQHTSIFKTAIGNAFDDAGDGFGRKFSGRDVIEKEKRAGSLNQNVVDAVINEIATDGVVNAGRESYLQFSANTIRGSYQHRLLHLGKRAVEHAAEAANLRQGARIEG